MEEGCDAMNVIDKLNQEFDVIMEKNIQLEKEKLELYKEIHKLKFKMILDEDRGEAGWGGGGLGYFCNDEDGFCGLTFDADGWLGWSDELKYAVEFGLEKNVILCEIYDEDVWTVASGRLVWAVFQY